MTNKVPLKVEIVNVINKMSLKAERVNKKVCGVSNVEI